MTVNNPIKQGRVKVPYQCGTYSFTNTVQYTRSDSWADEILRCDKYLTKGGKYKASRLEVTPSEVRLYLEGIALGFDPNCFKVMEKN